MTDTRQALAALIRAALSAQPVAGAVAQMELVDTRVDK